MKLLGIDLRRPNFGELTAAAVMGVGLWVAAVGLALALRIPIDRFDAGAMLIVVLWGCFSVRLGIRIDKGQRHLAANMVVSGALLLVYQGAWAMAAA
jgi:hypothetical protein